MNAVSEYNLISRNCSRGHLSCDLRETGTAYGSCALDASNFAGRKG